MIYVFIAVLVLSITNVSQQFEIYELKKEVKKLKENKEQ